MENGNPVCARAQDRNLAVRRPQSNHTARGQFARVVLACVLAGSTMIGFAGFAPVSAHPMPLGGCGGSAGPC